MKGDRRVDKLRLAHFAVVRAGIRTARSSPDASHAEAWQHGQPTGTGLAQAQTPGASPRSKTSTLVGSASVCGSKSALKEELEEPVRLEAG